MISARDDLKNLRDQISEMNYRLNRLASATAGNDPAQFAFLDTFADGAKYWAWKEHQTDASRVVTENVGNTIISIAGGTNARLWDAVNNAPKIVTGLPGWPCDVICKITDATLGLGLWGGVFIGYNVSQAAQAYMLCMRRAKSAAGLEGIVVSSISAASAHYANMAVTTYPIWLRIRMTSDLRYGNKFAFHYSLDNIIWTAYENVPGTPFEISDYGVTGGWATGLLMNNESTFNAGSMTFTMFRATRTFGPG